VFFLALSEDQPDPGKDLPLEVHQYINMLQACQEKKIFTFTKDWSGDENQACLTDFVM